MAVHVVMPEGIDDPARPSGGNVYDRHVCSGLAARGWSVSEHEVPGPWPRCDSAAEGALDDVVQRIPDDALVLIDGLIASATPAVLVPEASRLRLVVLVHMPLGHGAPGDEAQRLEGEMLASAAAVVTTSDWTRRRLLELYSLPAGRLHVAEPAADEAELAAGTTEGGAFLCVAAVTPGKGHDILVAALATLNEIPWQCECVGSLEREPAFVDDLRRRCDEAGLAGRISFQGPRTGADLDRSYAAADVLVLASRAETYGMVVGEALARGLPVVATDVGGVPDALGHGADAARPGLLVAPDDPGALAAALRGWLGDAELRARLRRAARERRETLARWSTTTSVVAGVLTGAER